MKTFINLLTLIIAFTLIYGCSGKRSAGKAGEEKDTVTVPDTGFTGISRGTSGEYIINEVTLKNGVRHGLMKTFYRSGRVRQTFWYENGLRQDSARWYFEEGQLFRTTPYKNDTINGIQKQYYRTGELKAELNYIKGLRTPFLREYSKEGKLISNYPEIVIKTQDNYSTKGVYRITMERSDKSEKVRFYRGEFIGGVFDTANIEKVRTVKGIGYLDLKKRNTSGPGYVGIIGEILTEYGNNLLVYKKIDLPYPDLN